MSETDQLSSIDTKDPEYYADLLCTIPRAAIRRPPSYGQSCPDIPGIQDVDIALTQPRQMLLDAVADLTLSTGQRLRHDDQPKG